MGADDAECDREAEASAAHRACAVILGAVEAFEEVGQVFGLDAATGIVHVDPGAADVVVWVNILADAERHGAAGRGVAQGVIEQDEHHLYQGVAISVDQYFLIRAQNELLPIYQHFGCADCFPRKQVERDNLCLGINSAGITVAAGKAEEVCNQPTHSLALTADIGEGVVDILHIVITARFQLLANHIHVALDGGEGSSQLVRGVCNKSLLGYKRLFNAIEHVVKCVSEFGDFVSCCRDFEPPRKGCDRAILGDGICAGHEPVHGCQRLTGQAPATDAGRSATDNAEQEQRLTELAQHVSCAGKRFACENHPDDHRHAGARIGYMAADNWIGVAPDSVAIYTVGVES